MKATNARGGHEMYLPDKAYHVIKWTALIALPATGAAYLGIAAATGLPHGSTVAEVCVVLGTFLGTLIGVSSHNWSKSNRGADRDGSG